MIGYGACLALDQKNVHEHHTDPGHQGSVGVCTPPRPPRPGEQVIVWRLLVDAEAGTRPSHSESLIRLWLGQEVITRTDSAWDFLSVDTNSDHWDPMLGHYDFHHASEAGYVIGTQRYDVYAHDWRRLSVDEWLDLTVDRELGAPPTLPIEAGTDLVPSEPEFTTAVQAALRDLRDTGRLADNPLLRSRLVGDASGGEPATEVLRNLIGQAAATLRDNPRNHGLYRVIDRTFLRPAPTQERAAEVLGLQFSTFRRHRNRGWRASSGGCGSVRCTARTAHRRVNLSAWVPTCV